MPKDLLPPICMMLSISLYWRDRWCISTWSSPLISQKGLPTLLYHMCQGSNNDVLEKLDVELARLLGIYPMLRLSSSLRGWDSSLGEWEMRILAPTALRELWKRKAMPPS